MHYIMTTGGHARKFVAFDRGHRLRIGIMDRALFKAARAQVAVQALAIIEGFVEFNRICGRSNVVLVSVLQAAELVMKRAIDGVVGVTRVASVIARYTCILKVGRWQIGRIVYVETFTVWLHYMTGKAKAGLLGSLHVFGYAE